MLRYLNWFKTSLVWILAVFRRLEGKFSEEEDDFKIMEAQLAWYSGSFLEGVSLQESPTNILYREKGGTSFHLFLHQELILYKKYSNRS